MPPRARAAHGSAERTGSYPPGTEASTRARSLMVRFGVPFGMQRAPKPHRDSPFARNTQGRQAGHGQPRRQPLTRILGGECGIEEAFGRQRRATGQYRQ